MLKLELLDHWREDGHSRRLRKAEGHRHPLGAVGPLALVPIVLDLLLRAVALEVRHQEGGVRRGREVVRHQEAHEAQSGTFWCKGNDDKFVKDVKRNKGICVDIKEAHMFLAVHDLEPRICAAISVAIMVNYVWPVYRHSGTNIIRTIQPNVRWVMLKNSQLLYKKCQVK